LLQSVPGIGETPRRTILYEIGETAFPTVKDFLSYCRLVKGTVASAGKIKGLRGATLGTLPALGFGEAGPVIAKPIIIWSGPYRSVWRQMGGNKFKSTPWWP